MNNDINKKKYKQEFEELFEKYSDVIYRLCLYKTSNEEIALDLTQETFLRLWQTMMQDKKIENIKSYIYQIARNIIIDHYKKKKTASLEALSEEGFEPQSQYVSSEILSEIGLLTQAIESLPDDLKEVIYLRYIEGFEVNAIAKTLNISENLVSVRISRGKSKLKEKFNYNI